MVDLIEIIVEVLQGVKSLFGRSRTGIDQIERQIGQRQQHDRILRTQTK